MKKLWLPLLLLVLAAGIWFVLDNKSAAPQVMFATLDGRRVAMSEMQGKVVLVNFWATSCPGCVKEIPHLAETYNQYHAQGFDVVAVAMSYDPPEHVVNFNKKFALPFTVALDADDSIARAFRDVQVTPTTFLIDRQGKIVQQITGEINFTQLHTTLDQLLKKS